MDPLVSTDWLAAQLGAPDLVVLDASVYLPGDARNARVLYEQAHIPGARFFDLELISDPDTPLPHMVPGAGRFAQRMGELGVANDRRVVCYDQHGLFSAARAWWMLRLFGHERAAVLDGGLPKWQAERRTLDSGAVGAAPALFRPTLHNRRLRGIGDVLANLVTRRELLLDARAADRFHARVPEPRPGMRGGHIPGAHSLPYTELLTPAKTLLPPEQLRRRFAQAGVGADSAVVTSCGSGVTAAALTLGLVVAGLPEGALYDGSWSEWGGRADTPVEES